MDGHVRTRLGRDDGGRVEHVPLGVLPPLAQAGEHDGRAVGAPEEVGLAAATGGLVPLVEAVGGDDDAPLPERLAERRPRGHGLAPRAGVQFGVNPPDIGADGFKAHPDLGGDFLRRQPFGELFQHLPFPFGKRLQGRGRRFARLRAERRNHFGGHFTRHGRAALHDLLHGLV